MNRHIIIRLVSASLMIIAGVAIYIITRQDIIFFNWIPEAVLDIGKKYTVNSNSIPEYFIVYCVPDGLWYGALLLFQSAFHNNTITSKTICLISITLPFVWEVLQISNDVPGTFDPIDLFVYFITITIFIIFNHKYYEHT